MPAAVICRLNLKHPYIPTGSQIHGLFFELFRHLDADIADEFHAAHRKPFTVSPLLGAEEVAGEGGRKTVRVRVLRQPAARPNGRPKTYRETEAWLRFTLLDDRVSMHLPRLLAGARLPKSGFRVGPSSIQFSAFSADPRFHPLARLQTYAELAPPGAAAPAGGKNESPEQPLPKDGNRGIRLLFMTPTALRVQGANLPLPDPATLFTGYWHKWNMLSPVPAPDNVLTAIREEAAVRVSRHRIQTRLHRLSRAAQIGFIGEVSFQFASPDPEIRAWLTSLANFSTYSGSGYKTTMGMGLTAIA